ncbi:MAG: bifunctional DNA primase/polymerase [Melioribacteraceae bacterium]
MSINDKLFEYLKSKIPIFEKTSSKGLALFTCPNIGKHKWKKDPSATIINGSDIIRCFDCGFKGTFADAVRLLEPDKKNYTDARITEYIIDTYQADIYSEFAQYKKYNWSLVPVMKNGKNPIEKDWTDITHYEKIDWIKWANNGLNLGIRTGEVSKITVIDFDNKPGLTEEQLKVKEELRLQLEGLKTLKQNTAHGGCHYVIQYTSELKQTTDIAGLKIDIRNDGGQILTQPSIVDANKYQWVNLGNEIKIISDEIKNKVLELMKVEVSRSENNYSEIKSASTDKPFLKHNNLEGRCNDTFTQLAGALVKKLTPDQTEYVMHLMNKYLLEKPMDVKAISAMMGSVSDYKKTEESTQEKLILEYLKQMQNDVTAKDIMDSLTIPRAIADKYLSKFVKDGKAIRLSRGRYKFREKVEWNDKYPVITKKINYKIPYFEDLQDYEEGDIIVLGGKPGSGKTTTSLNILKQVVEQKVKPYYIFSESGSRHYKIASKLGIQEGEFYHSYHSNPLSIEIEPHAFTILDWLMVEEKENTDRVFKFLTEEMERKGGILIVMMQLKESGDWYAPNMVNQFPALGARYFIDGDDRKTGHWQIDKVRDARYGVFNSIIQCEFNPESKIITTKDVI